jgi:hypothetical protein
MKINFSLKKLACILILFSLNKAEKPLKVIHYHILRIGDRSMKMESKIKKKKTKQHKSKLFTK